MKLDNDLLRNMISETLEEIIMAKGGSAGDDAYEHYKSGEKDREAEEQAKNKRDRENRKAQQNSQIPPGITKEELAEEISAEVAKLQSAAADAKEKAAEAEEEATSAEAEQAKQEAEKAAQEAGATMEESFQLTKGRLRQIITEELISAKKQGIL